METKPENVHIEGYASVFSCVDQCNDVIAKGAFEGSIRDKFSFIKLLWQHDVSLPIGNIVCIQEDNYGLFIRAILTQKTQIGREAVELIKLGIVTGLSVGLVSENSRLNLKGQNEILKATLHEVSVVTFPANCQAKITSVYEGQKPPGLTDLVRSAHAIKNSIQQLRG